MEPEHKNTRPWPRLAQAGVLSLFMGGFVLLAFFGILRLHSSLATASIAASTFIAFAYPYTDSGRPRFLIGGYACGLVCGGVCSLLRARLAPGTSLAELETCILFCALAVALTGFCMMALRLQHPPAAALSISMVVENNPLWVGLSVFAVILLLCALRWLVFRLLGRYLGLPAQSTTKEAPHETE